MQVSDGALREGLIYERLGRIQSEDTRLKTISSIQQRFQISQKHARRVSKTSHYLFSLCSKDWGFTLSHAELLHWASSLHEIGLAIAHSGYHKHGAYLLDYTDLPGFSYEEQDWMSVLVRCHRKKLSRKSFSNLPEENYQMALRLSVLLRLAALLHRSRKDSVAKIASLNTSDSGLELRFVDGELKKHPLLLASLKRHADYLQAVGFELLYC